MIPVPDSSARSAARLLLSLGSLVASASGLLAQQAGDSPVKIFIMAGQSNMLGQGEISPVTTPGTLEHVVANDSGGDYEFLIDGEGDWVVREDVWIRDQDPSQSGLTVGFGSNSGTIGPELGFGHFMGDLGERQVLVVKAAWGGRSLAEDFRPPSSGGDTGFYYDEILRLVTEATSDLGSYFPDYDGGGYEIAGFVWHQGWNDRVTPSFAAEYETNMANFIRDMRSDEHGLGVPDLPFVIATTGMDGGDAYSEVEQAQLAMADATAYSDFADNVAVIDTRSTYNGLGFWQPGESSPAVEGFHWNRNARTYLNLGLAMGDAMSILAPGRCPFRPRATGGPGGVTVSWENGTETPTSVRVLRDGVEIAAAAPADPPGFLDTAAEPGVLDYELIFTMPGDPCDPLETTLDGGITDLELSREPGGLVLTWSNNMAYSGIEVRRDGELEASLSGDTNTFTDGSPPTSGVVTYTVAPTTGDSAPASVEINLDLEGELGVLDPTLANGGINPATGAAWAAGDEYRLAFVSSAGTQATSTDITTYNAFVQGFADAAGLGGGNWRVMGSTAAVAARDNTSTHPTNDGVGVSAFLVDGLTKIADNHADLWNGDLDNPLNTDETGDGGLTGSVFTGSEPDGTQRSNGRVLGGSEENPAKVTIGEMQQIGGQWMVIFNAESTSSQPVYALSDPLTIIDTSDETPPTLNSFDDNKSGGPIQVSETVTYTVTFSEPMKASSVDAGDFGNAAAAPITINGVRSTGDPAVFEIEVTPTGSGTLRLQVKADADLTDLAGNALNTDSAIPDDTAITVDVETTPPTLLSFADDLDGGPVLVGASVPYTVTFSEAMNAATVGTADFDNAATAAITIDGVAPTEDPAVFEVVVTADGPGTLRLGVAAGAELEDLSGNLLDAGSASPDDTTITVNTPPDLAGQLGILDVTANGGINPSTGNAWQTGDSYRLAFVTSATTQATSSDIATYNAFVQGLADATPALGDGAWKVVGSTATVDARNNTGTNPGTDGVGVSIFLMDGSSVFASDNADLWDGADVALRFDELGNEVTTNVDRIFTGTEVNGTRHPATQTLGGSPNVQTGRADTAGNGWIRNFNVAATDSKRVYALSAPLAIVSISDSTFADYMAGFPTVGGMDGFTEDPDGDGLANGLEAWFGTDPGEPNAGLAGLVTEGTTTTFTHPRNADAPADLSGYYQWSPDLTDWYVGDGVDAPPDGPTVTITPETTGATTTVTVTASEAMPSLFLRAGVVPD